MEKSNQLSVESYHFEELHVTRNAVYADGESANVPQPRVTVEFDAYTHKTELDRFAVSLHVKSEEPITEDHPLRFSARVMGFFRLEEPTVGNILPAERVINGLTILYGILRANVGTIGGWFDDPVILPTVYFTDLVNSKIEAAKNNRIESAQSLAEAAVS